MRSGVASHRFPSFDAEQGGGLVDGALVACVAGGLSAPRRLTATPPEDICASVNGGWSCWRF